MLNPLRHASLRRTLKGLRFLSTIETPLNPSSLQIHHTSSPKPKIPNQELRFGKTFTDHMLEVDWTLGKGWTTPVIRPYGPLALDPASAVLHYALECFEGMKAYRDVDDHVRLFRPEMNMERLNRSMERLLLPTFEGPAFLACLKELLRSDKDWIPRGDGYALYIRPTAISTQASIGVGASERAKLFVILSPVGPYYPDGFNPVKLYANDRYVRAWPGGTGAFKLGANYASGILPQLSATAQGYAQNLWLFGPEHEITEVGTMNLFIHWINDHGVQELVTPPLSRQDILPGITRDSILHLTREWKEFQVTEANINMKQLQQASEEDRILEIFGSGTAAVVSPVSTIHYMDKDLVIPLKGTDKKAGPVAERIWKELSDIQYGRREHPWSVIVD